MIDDTFVETLFSLVTSSSDNIGTIAASLFGAYKVAKRHSDRQERKDELRRERDKKIYEYIRDQLVFTRSDVFEGTASMVDKAERDGKSKIELRIKCIASKVSFDAFLEKIDRNAKDALTEKLPGYFEKNIELHGYDKLVADKESKKLDEKIMQDAKDFKKSLWNELSKEVGYSDHFKIAYNQGFTDKDAFETCKKIILHILVTRSRYEQKIRDEKFFRFGRKRKA